MGLTLNSRLRLMTPHTTIWSNGRLLEGIKTQYKLSYVLMQPRVPSLECLQT